MKKINNGGGNTQLLDRFFDGNTDLQQINPLNDCCICHGEIYEGDIYYEIGGEIFHYECLEEFAKLYFEEFKRG